MKLPYKIGNHLGKIILVFKYLTDILKLKTIKLMYQKLIKSKISYTILFIGKYI